MSTEETRIIEFLSAHPNLFVSVTELSKFLDGKKFQLDRAWASTLLRGMELRGLIEANVFGEYRVKKQEGDTKHFKNALGQPGAKLGDTTIIFLDESQPADTSTTTVAMAKTAQAVGS
jgi:hypothetical protein